MLKLEIAHNLWRASGIVLLGAIAYWTWLSFAFVYGEGHPERPIIGFLLVYAVAWFAFFTASLLCSFGHQSPGLGLLLFVAVAARLLLLPSNLIQENDVYRYVLDGQVLLHGDNPYSYSPLEWSEFADEPLAGSLKTSEAQLVMHRIGYPHVPTVYPPAAQAVFALGACLGGWNWIGQRTVFLAFDLALMLLLLRVLVTMSISRDWIILYAWNPLVLKEVVNSVHLDVLVGFLLLLTLWTLLLFRTRKHWSLSLLSGAFLGLSILTKLYPAILIPACVAAFLRGGYRRAAVGFLLSVCGVLVAGYVPFLGIGSSRLLAGLTTYAAGWRMNDGFFALLDMTTPYPRGVAFLFVMVFALGLPWFGAKEGYKRPAQDFFWILLAWFLVIPTPFPWYALPIVAVSVLTGSASVPVVALSGALALYYLGFFYEYHNYPPIWWALTRGIEHFILWTASFWTLWSCRSRPAPQKALSSRAALFRRSAVFKADLSGGSQQHPPPS